jgi:hypothetical protein
MLERLIDLLVEGELAASELICHFDIDGFRQSDLFSEQVRLLDNPDHRKSEFSLIPNNNSIPVTTYREWVVSLIRVWDSPNIGYNIAGKTVMINLSKSTSIDIDVYKARGAGLADEKEASQCFAKHHGKEVIHPESILIFSDTDLIYKVEYKGESPLFLLLQEPPKHHSFHGFDLNSGDYLFTAFSSVEAAGMHYVSDLLKSYVKEEIGAREIDDNHKNDLVRCVKRIFYHSDLPPLSRWLCLQSMASLSTSECLAMLRHVEHEDSTVGALARKHIKAFENENAV